MDDAAFATPGAVRAGDRAYVNHAQPKLLHPAGMPVAPPRGIDQKLKEYLTQRMPVNAFIEDLMKAAKWKNYLKEPARATPMGGMDPRQMPRRGVPAGPSR